jgi:hypothetical protein
LQIEYQNPQFDRTDDWAKAIAGGTYPLHADFEWTQVLAPEEEYDQFGLVGSVGWMINPHHSSADVPFSHPFRDGSTGTIFDWEFLLALDQDTTNPNRDYAFLLAAGNHDDTKHVDETRQLGIPVPENGLLGVEIDGALVPQGFKDSAKTGNRVAVFGRWIVDTGHEVGPHATFKSEIHPPLLLASANVQKQVDGSLVTRVLFTSRPYLVGQRFTVETDKIYDDRAEDDGPLFKHLIKELLKVASPIPLSLLVEAHPKIKSHPFLGAHLLHIKVRPPALTGLPTITASKRLAVSFQFTVRTGCAVQVSSSSTDTVDVFISLSHGGYIPPPLPHRNAKRYSRQELDALSPGVGNQILEGEAVTLFAGALGGPANAAQVAAILSRGIETDEYDPLPQIDINDAQHAVTNAFANAVPPGAGIVHDDAQRFPIFGWLEAKWVDSAVLHP